MKIFRPTYLYVKTHKISGLKYFGKTISANPSSYRGSGTYWLHHLKIYGNDVLTEIIGFYCDEEECKKAALKFSEDNDIVNATNQTGKKVWANQIVENGLDGGATTFGPRPREVVDRIAFARRNRITTLEERERYRINGIVNGAKGRKRKSGEWSPSAETRQKLSKANKGKKLSLETRNKLSKNRSGKKRPEATKWLTGRVVSEITRRKISESNKGKIVSQETKDKIKVARAKQIITFETKQKLSGYVVVVDEQGNKSRISKDQYWSQTGPKSTWKWIFHKATEANIRMRRG